MYKLGLEQELNRKLHKSMISPICYFLSKPMTEDNHDDEFPKPHAWYYNPGKFLIDNFFSIGATIVKPVYKITTYSTLSNSQETISYLQQQRQRTKNRFKLLIRINEYKWNKMFPGGVEKMWIDIPRKHSILKDWDIVTSKDYSEIIHTQDVAESVNVFFQVPTNLLPDKPHPSNERKSLDWSHIDSSVPIMIFFYGGGMIMKGSRGGASILARDIVLLQQQKEQMESRKSPSDKNIILAVIDYRVAPDDPFPAAVIDTLSTVEYLVQNCQNPIHVIGQSAGANLASVLALETHRKYPGRVKSAFIWDPMLNPNANSMSYYMNSLSSGLAPVYYLRWAWRAYLGLGDVSEIEHAEETLSSQNETEVILNKDSNQKLVLRSKWHKNKAWWRLCYPTTDVPKGLDSEEAPEFLLSSALGDPLYEDGVELFNKLKECGACVSFLPCRGSHILAYLVDTEKKKMINEKLREFFFGQ